MQLYYIMGINDSLGDGVAKGPSNVVRVQVPSADVLSGLSLLWYFFCSGRFSPGIRFSLFSNTNFPFRYGKHFQLFEGLSTVIALSVIFSKIVFYHTRLEKNGELSQVLWSNKTRPMPLVQLG